MAIDLSAIKIVRTTPPNPVAGAAAVEEHLALKPVAPGVWDEFLALQISPTIRRSYAAGLRGCLKSREVCKKAHKSISYE
jgi:hypothetical protein